MFTERRRTRRVNIKMMVCCSPCSDMAEDKDLRDFSDYTVNVSTRGAHIVVKNRFKKKQHFILAFDIPGSFPPIPLQCEVVWFKKTSSDRSTGYYEAGVRFLKTDPVDIAYLERTLRLRDVPCREHVLEPVATR